MTDRTPTAAHTPAGKLARSFILNAPIPGGVGPWEKALADMDSLLTDRDYLKAALRDATEALNEMHANTENRQDEPYVAYIRRTCAFAIARATEVLK